MHVMDGMCLQLGLLSPSHTERRRGRRTRLSWIAWVTINIHSVCLYTYAGDSSFSHLPLSPQRLERHILHVVRLISLLTVELNFSSLIQDMIKHIRLLLKYNVTLITCGWCAEIILWYLM